ncbi:MAG: DNA internalization-related competence protein ComEC/Rec2 [Candidatus Saccharicenans sp.]
MAAPFLFPAISFLAGLIVSSATASHFSAWLTWLSGISLFFSWLAYLLKKNRAALAGIVLSFFLCGFMYFAYENHLYQSNPVFKLEPEKYFDFEGTLLKAPERYSDHDVLIIRLTSVELENQKVEIKANIRLSVPHSTTSEQPLELHAGDRLSFSAVLHQEEAFKNFFPDFSRKYLRSQRIHLRASTKNPLLIKKINQENRSWNGFFSKLRRKLQRQVEKDFPGQQKFSLSPEGGLIEALLLGADRRIDRQTDRQFQKTGLYHLIAISGAHVAVITFFLYSFLGLFRLKKRTINIILLFLLFFYAFLVEGQPSVFRAVLMTSLFLLGKLLDYDINYLNLLSLSVVLLLLINPFSFEEAGFQLTFLATLSLILFFQPIVRRLPAWPFKIPEMLALSLAAVLGTMPVIVADFNRVALATIILTPLAAPLVGLIMGAGYIYLLVGAVLPGLGHLLSFPLGWLTRLFAWMTTWLEPFSSLSYRLPSPPLAVIIGYYATLLLLLVRPKFKAQRAAVGLAFILFLFCLVTYPFPPSSSGPAVTFLDVGQGDSTLVELPGRKIMLIDGGGFSNSSFDPGEAIVSKYLWHKGYKKIDFLVSTHLHPDHALGLTALASNFQVKEFWWAEEDPNNPLFSSIIKALPKKCQKIKIRKGYNRQVNGAVLEVLYPDESPEAPAARGNDASAVIRLEMSGWNFLFPGDITSVVEEYLTGQSSSKLRAQVLKVPHHGSQSSSSPGFLQAVSPRVAVISCGRNNISGLPSEVVLNRLQQAGFEIFRTDADGAVEIKIREKLIQIRTARSNRTLSLGAE